MEIIVIGIVSLLLVFCLGSTVIVYYYRYTWSEIVDITVDRILPIIVSCVVIGIMGRAIVNSLPETERVKVYKVDRVMRGWLNNVKNGTDEQSRLF